MKTKIKLSDMTISLRDKICDKHREADDCKGCPFAGRNNGNHWSVCDTHSWSAYPDHKIEIDEEVK